MAELIRKLILLVGKPVRIDGDNILKVALMQWGTKVGLDIRLWYKKPAEKMTEEDKARMDDLGYLPGKGVFLPLTHVAITHSKLGQILEDPTFLKLLAEAKSGETTTSKVDPEKEKLRKELEEMRRMMAELKAASASKAAPTSSGDGIDEVEVPTSTLTRTPGKGKSSKK